jgi:hypothetical protein
MQIAVTDGMIQYPVDTGIVGVEETVVGIIRHGVVGFS